MQEYNICFTTVERRPVVGGGEATADGDLGLPDLPEPSLSAGVLPTQVSPAGGEGEVGGWGVRPQLTVVTWVNLTCPTPRYQL